MAEIFCEDVESLVARYQNGDDGAFEILTERFMPLLRHEVGRFFRGMDAEEALGEAYSVLHNAAKHYTPGHGTTFGLYAKICLERAMSAHAKSYPPMAPAEETKSEEQAVDFESGLIRADSFSRMLDKIRELTSKTEFTVLQYYLQGYSEKEIASVLHRSEKQVANAKARVFRKLRENATDLSRYYF